MCRILRSGGDGGALFVGDSLSQEFEFSLKNALLRQGYNSSAPDYDTNRGCDFGIGRTTRAAIELCPPTDDGWELMVQAIRADRNIFLAAKDEDIKDRVSNFEESNLFTKLFVAQSPALLVMNRGAHFEPSSKVITDLNRSLHFIFCKNPNTSVVFRSTVPGHFQYDRDFFKHLIPRFRQNGTT